VKKELRDNGGRRSGIDLRQFLYTNHIPERRSGHGRRSSLDRRNGLDRRSYEDRRSYIDLRKEQKAENKIIEMRSHINRRSDADRRAAFR